MWSEEYGTAYVDRDVPNPWGFYSMFGNVNEWVGNMDIAITKDQVLPDNFKGSDPAGGGSIGMRMLRGGSWKSAEIYSCCYYSLTVRDYAGDGRCDSGFRIAMEVESSGE